MSEIYPFPFDRDNFLNDVRGPQESESPLDKMMRAIREQGAIRARVEAANEIPHKHMCRVVNGVPYAIRWCVVPGCMQSWRMYAQADYPGEFPAEWERIEEPVDLSTPVLPDYED